MQHRKLFELTEYRHRVIPALTKREIAKILRVSTSAVSRWENGSRSPSRDMAFKIAGLTGKPVAQISGLM